MKTYTTVPGMIYLCDDESGLYVTKSDYLDLLNQLEQAKLQLTAAKNETMIYKNKFIILDAENFTLKLEYENLKKKRQTLSIIVDNSIGDNTILYTGE